LGLCLVRGGGRLNAGPFGGELQALSVGKERHDRALDLDTTLQERIETETETEIKQNAKCTVEKKRKHNRKLMLCIYL
jgi:hypothetical protein